MRRRRLLLGAGALALLGAGWLVWAVWYYRPWDPIGSFTYRRLSLGMTRKEVETAIGLPPGDYHTYALTGGSIGPGSSSYLIAKSGLPESELPSWPFNRPKKLSDGRTVTVEEWWGNAFKIWVVFDQDETVVGTYLGRISWEES